MNSPKLGNKHPREPGKNKQQLPASQTDYSDGEELSPSQILERVKPDRVTASKPEEDRRRRTIIVEKQNGSFGFTLQSYGIHYKKEQEIEMITYVDYVDYDGAAFRAGMREGDVILSINGHDMEKADHKTLVNYIKNCDSRMRMVVLFEDCVRKVELHMRYIQLQRVLQGKMAELERLCLRERELLQGKWKTHSLPARKKTASTSTDASTPTHHPADYPYCRPTVSTEDVARVQQQPQTQQLMLAYQYLDPLYGGYCLQRSTNNSGEYLVAWPTPRNHVMASNACDVQPRHSSNAKGYHQTNGVAAAASTGRSTNCGNGGGSKGSGKSGPTTHHHTCNPCVQASNQDNSSLEAYDLASPCCDPHCVPSSRRRSRHHKDHRNNAGSGGGGGSGGGKSASKSSQDSRGWKDKCRMGGGMQHPAPSQPSCSATAAAVSAAHGRHPHGRYFNLGPSLVSQCSLHSCTSSEQGGAEGESSAASYTTSLSTDTLYWDAPCEVGTSSRPSMTVTTSGGGMLQGPASGGRNHSSKVVCSKHGISSSTHPHHHHHHHHNHHHQQQPQQYNSMPQHSSSYNPAKPAKSWDNLTTKAFGGYGFGYGYLDMTGPKSGKSSHTRAHSIKGGSGMAQQSRSVDRRVPAGAGLYSHQPRYVQPTKSTESLLLLQPKYGGGADAMLSDSSLSCDCLDAASPVGAPHFFEQYHNKASQTDAKKGPQGADAEITRL